MGLAALCAERMQTVWRNLLYISLATVCEKYFTVSIQTAGTVILSDHISSY
jgi:hypothetical protein